MKSKEPANLPNGDRAGRLARKRYSFRLPIRVAARFEALCEVHPQKTRTQIMGDLLTLGLAGAEQARPLATAGAADYHPDTRQPIYLMTGPFAEFHGLVRKHHRAMAHDLAKDDPDIDRRLDEFMLDDTE
jgi:hypothetical protein